MGGRNLECLLETVTFDEKWPAIHKREPLSPREEQEQRPWGGTRGRKQGCFSISSSSQVLNVSVSQDFVLGPPVFFICILSLGELIQSVALSTVFMIMTFEIIAPV